MSEIVLLIGYNAAGKTTLVKDFVDRGYERVNRDDLGGRLKDLPSHVADLVKQGKTQIVMDNTYADIESRQGIITMAQSLKLPIRCVWLNTSFEDAQYNACQRMIRDTGGLLMPEQLKKTKNPNHFPPVALFSYKKRFQKPTPSEGFVSVTIEPFVRSPSPGYDNEAYIFDYDGTLRESMGQNDYPITEAEVKLLPGRKEKLAKIKQQEKHKLLLGVSNQSGVAKKILTEDMARRCFEKTNELLDTPIQYLFCPHNIPPVVCYCRKPHCGLGVTLIEQHKLNAAKCIFIGDQTTDKTFAERCGFQYQDASAFFGDS